MKHISLNKKLMLRNLKKFSNVNLFDRREKQNSSSLFRSPHGQTTNYN